MTWPLVIRELKSTRISRIIPETWLPTSTFFTGESWPLAWTAWTMSPRFRVSIFAVMGNALDFDFHQAQVPTPPPIRISRKIQLNQLIRRLRTAMQIDVEF